ncbi:hypothetical protein BN903_138 [Halorubrum sp. AJ67]|nr:hypothetical protein BN903_138 [Halorubrum sp. AJ67]
MTFWNLPELGKSHLPNTERVVARVPALFSLKRILNHSVKQACEVTDRFQHFWMIF